MTDTSVAGGRGEIVAGLTGKSALVKDLPRSVRLLLGEFAAQVRDQSAAPVDLWLAAPEKAWRRLPAGRSTRP